MSYILGALKKAEEERKKDQEPSSLHATHLTSPGFKEKKSLSALLRPIFLAPLLLLTAYYFYTNHLKTIPSATITHSRDTAAPITLAPQEEQTTRDSTYEIPELKPAKSKVAIAKEEPRDNVVLQPSPILPDPPPPRPVPSSKNHMIPYLEELSSEFQESVPTLKLTGHVYSADPKLRMIMINSTIAREEDVVEREYILEEIIPEGVIIRSSDTLFRLDVE